MVHTPQGQSLGATLTQIWQGPSSTARSGITGDKSTAALARSPKFDHEVGNDGAAWELKDELNQPQCGARCKYLINFTYSIQSCWTILVGFQKISTTEVADDWWGVKVEQVSENIR